MRPGDHPWGGHFSLSAAEMLLKECEKVHELHFLRNGKDGLEFLTAASPNESKGSQEKGEKTGRVGRCRGAAKAPNFLLIAGLNLGDPFGSKSLGFRFIDDDAVAQFDIVATFDPDTAAIGIAGLLSGTVEIVFIGSAKAKIVYTAKFWEFPAKRIVLGAFDGQGHGAELVRPTIGIGRTDLWWDGSTEAVFYLTAARARRILGRTGVRAGGIGEITESLVATIGRVGADMRCGNACI